jgi:hypothetical protein
MACELAWAILKRDHDAQETVWQRHEQKQTIKQELTKLLPRHSGRDASRFASEVLNSQFHRSFQNALLSDDYVRCMCQGGPIGGPELLYVLCRIVRPSCVIETGVGPGVSTGYILKAMHQNKLGFLYSIDMPTREQELWKSSEEYRQALKTIIPSPCDDHLKEIRPSGWLVPESLRDRWELRVGLSRQVLPQLLRDVPELDVFLHDSEHTYENMLFEYRSAWPRLRQGGILISHDVGWNRAFPEFAQEVNHTPILLKWFGAIVK